MFDLAEKRLVWIPVKWNGVKAGTDPDAIAENVVHEIQAQVELVDSDELKKILGEESKLENLERFKRLVHNWRGVKMGKADAPMTDENIQIMLRVPMFPVGFETSYLKAWGGLLEERTKNSNASSDAGQADEAPAEQKK